jgi:hypothetical protein
MKHMIAVAAAASLALTSLPGVWAQGASGTTAPSAAGHPDEIVQMHQRVAAANRDYDREVASAKKVYDHKKSEAKKKRDIAVAAAHHGVDQ